MPNAQRGVVEIRIGGTNRKAKLGFNAVCSIEEEFGKPIQQIFSLDGVGVRHLRSVMYWSLLEAAEDPDIRTPQLPDEYSLWMVGRWIQDVEGDWQSYFAPIVGEMVNNAIGAENAEATVDGGPLDPRRPEASTKKPPAGGTGKSSSRKRRSAG